MPRCKICEKIATRSSVKGTFCEEHYWSHGADGSSVAEQAAAKQHLIKGNYD